MARITPKEPTASTPVHPSTKNSSIPYPHDTNNDNNNTETNNTPSENNNPNTENNNDNNA